MRDKLEKHFRDMQDIEFTIQRGKLYMLQCRTGKRTARAAVRIAVEMVKEGLISREEGDPPRRPVVDRSAPPPHARSAAPRRRSSRAGCRRARARRAGKSSSAPTKPSAAPGRAWPVILVRVETSPEDIHGMKAARGILTARGGMTSHAAVVARGMGKCCVAGCSAISVDYARAGDDDHRLRRRRAHQKRHVRVKAGDVITLDGGDGQRLPGRGAHRARRAHRRVRRAHGVGRRGAHA